ncbi:MAG: hypothetical protein KF718_30605 [Polyangiaceae bacterium]|nr:hypothetical protein [Polyangiaceae bacterium]
MRPPVALLFVSLLASCGSRSGLSTSDEAGSASGGSSGGAATGGASSGGAGGSDAQAGLCPPGSPPVVLVGEAHDAYGIALDASHVYFTRAPSSGSGLVQRVPKTGGAVETLAAGQSRPRSLVVDQTHVYFTTPTSGEVKRVRKDGAALTVLASFQNFPEGIAVAGSWLFWVRSSAPGGKLMRLALPDGQPEVLVDGINDAWALAEHSGWLYYTAGSTSTSVSPRIQRFGASWSPGTPPETLALIDLGMHALAVDATHVYYSTNPDLGRVAKAGGAPVTLFGGGFFVRGVYAAAAHVYFVESAGAGAPEGAVHRYDKTSGQLETIATAQHVPRAVAADTDCVYWTNSGFQSAGGSVMRGPR